MLSEREVKQIERSLANSEQDSRALMSSQWSRYWLRVCFEERMLRPRSVSASMRLR
jgi:hypothetical protein